MKRRNLLLFQHGRGQATQAMEDSALSLFGKFFYDKFFKSESSKRCLREGVAYRVGVQSYGSRE